MVTSEALHFIFESAAYAIGFAVYGRLKKRWPDPLNDDHRTWIIAAAIAGAAIGSKLLNVFERPDLLARHWRDPFFYLGGKTVVGAIVGGWIAVEFAKKRLGVTRRSGDLFAIPLAVGIIIGRIGCFFGGLADATYGLPSNLPWAVDFGDGVMRHPTQLYEIVYLMGVIAVLWFVSKRNHREGDLFKLFMIFYMAFRLVVEFLKPRVPIAGLSSIQWCCALVLCFYGRDVAYFVKSSIDFEWLTKSGRISSTTRP